MNKQLEQDFIDQLKKFFKSNDTSYIVLNVDVLLKTIDKMQYLELSNIIDQHDDYIETELQQEVPSYFIIERNKLPQCKTQKDFEELIFK